MPAMGGKDKKQMWVLLKAKDMTSAAFKNMKKTATQSIKAIKQGFVALEASVLAFSAAVLGSGVIAFKKMITLAKDLAVGAVNTAAQFEALEMQFGVLMGSAEKGKEVFDELWEVAQKIPFTIDDIATSARALKAWGVLGKDIETAMIGVADASALAGQSMDLMAVVIGRAWQQGRFLTRGPGALLQGIMKTKMGFDASKASVMEFRKALADLLTNPKYGVAGMSQKLATTFIGIKSMISDAVTGIKLVIARSGLFDEVKAFAEDIRVWLRSAPVLKRFKELGKVVTSVVESARKKFNEMVKSGEVDALVKDWIGLVRRFGNLLKNLIANAPAIGQVIMNIASTIGIIMENIGKGISKIMPKVGLLTGEVGRLERTAKAQTEAWSRTLKRLEPYNKMVDEANKKMKTQEGFVKNMWMHYKSGMEKAVQGNQELSKEYETLSRWEKWLSNKWKVEGSQAKYRKQFTEEFLALALKIQKIELDREARQKKQLEGTRDELARWQDNYIAIGNVKAEVQKLMGDLSNVKWKTEELTQETNKLAFSWKGVGMKVLETGKAMFPMIEKTKTAITVIKQSWKNMFKEVKEDAFDFGEDEIRTLSEQWDDFLKKLTEKWKKKNAEMADVVVSMAKASASAFEDFFFDLLTGEFKSLKDYLNSFVRDMARAIAQAMATKVAMSMFSGLQRGGMVQKKQTGGIAQGRSGIDTVPIAATPGEMFLNKRQQRNLFNLINSGGGKGGGGPNITMINNISSMDGADAYRTFERNSDAMVSVLRKKMSSGGRAGYRGGVR